MPVFLRVRTTVYEDLQRCVLSPMGLFSVRSGLAIDCCQFICPASCLGRRSGQQSGQSRIECIDALLSAKGASGRRRDNLVYSGCLNCESHILAKRFSAVADSISRC